LGQENNFAEAIRELEPLQEKPDIALAVCAALMTVHKGASQKDKEALNKLKEKLKVLSKGVRHISSFLYVMLLTHRRTRAVWL
jgi:hypothetical protein